MNRNTSTSAVQTPSAGRSRSGNLDALATRRGRLRSRCTTGPTATRAAHRTSQKTSAPTARVTSTIPIIKTAIVEPCGQFCAPLNWLSISAPTIQPFVPPRIVPVT